MINMCAAIVHTYVIVMAVSNNMRWKGYSSFVHMLTSNGEFTIPCQQTQLIIRA